MEWGDDLFSLSDLIISAASLRWGDLKGSSFGEVAQEYVTAKKLQIPSMWEAHNSNRGFYSSVFTVKQKFSLWKKGVQSPWADDAVTMLNSDSVQSPQLSRPETFGVEEEEWEITILKEAHTVYLHNAHFNLHLFVLIPA